MNTQNVWDAYHAVGETLGRDWSIFAYRWVDPEHSEIRVPAGPDHFLAGVLADERWCASVSSIGNEDADEICSHDDGPPRGAAPETVCRWLVDLLLMGHHPRGHCESSPDLESLDWDDRERLLAEYDAAVERGDARPLAVRSLDQVRGGLIRLLGAEPVLPHDDEPPREASEPAGPTRFRAVVVLPDVECVGAWLTRAEAARMALHQLAVPQTYSVVLSDERGDLSTHTVRFDPREYGA